MRTMLRAFAFATALPLVAPALGAQMPVAISGPGRGPAVTFLLSHTGELQLTDQQVVKLAAIARRAADRHKTMRDAMRASFDSLRTQFHRGGDSGMRHREGPPAQLRAAMEKERDATHADLRDALAVLTPDQQATAWELVSHNRQMIRRMGPGRGGPNMRFRAGPMMMHRDGAALQMPDDGQDEAYYNPGPDDDEQVAIWVDDED